MSRIANAIIAQKQKGHAALIPFITVGDPTLELTLDIIDDLTSAGADVIELGIPYSDPLADGPVIQEASLRSLQNGFQLPQVFDVIKEIRKRGKSVPLIVFTYANPILQYGIEKFVQTAKESGADGFIVPDLPIEESGDLLALTDQYGLDLIPLVAPTSQKRVVEICKQARGFVYCVSSLGVTGERAQFADNLDRFLEQVYASSSVPVGLGFGISTPTQAQSMANKTDAIIIGSAIVRRIG